MVGLVIKIDDIEFPVLMPPGVDITASISSISEPEEGNFNCGNDMNPFEYEQEFNIQRDNAPDLRFHGIVLAVGCDDANAKEPNFSGEEGVERNFELYRTRAGAFVAYRDERRFDDFVYCRAIVAYTEAEVIEFLGQGCQAKDMYRFADIENVEFVA